MSQFYIILESYSGNKVPIRHKTYQTSKDAEQAGLSTLEAGGYKTFSVQQLDESIKQEVKKAVQKPTKKKPVNEGVLDSVDDEGWLARTELYNLAKAAIELHKVIGDTDQLDPWIQQKIARANEYIRSIKAHMDASLPAIADEFGSEINAPEVSLEQDLDSMFFESENFAKMEDGQLEAWVKLNDGKANSAEFAQKLRAAKQELKRRKTKTNESDDPCWDDYKMVGTKKKGKKKVPNCVPESKITEGKKLIHRERAGNKEVKVYYDSEWGEYVAKLFNNGKHYSPADHFTDDKKDAIGTAKLMVKENVSETTTAGSVATVSQPMGQMVSRTSKPKSKKKKR